MKKIKVYLTTLVVGIILSTSVYAEVVNFSDPNFEEAVRQNIATNKYEVTNENEANLTYTGNILKSDLEELTVLYAPEYDIKSIEGIEYFINLEKIYLDGNDISDISELSKLEKLQYINLKDNDIEDVSPLKDLQYIDTIYIEDNDIKDTSIIDAIKDKTDMDSSSSNTSNSNTNNSDNTSNKDDKKDENDSNIEDDFSEGKPAAWAVEYVLTAKKNDLIPSTLIGKYDQKITRAEYAVLALELYKKSGKKINISEKKPFNDIKGHKYEDELVLAKNAGIINGRGDGIFDPDNFVTRQEIAILVANLEKAFMGKIDLNSGKKVTFSDGKDIAPWALSYVEYCYNRGLMKGTTNTTKPTIAPLNNATRQEAIIMMVRMGNNQKVIEE